MMRSSARTYRAGAIVLALAATIATTVSCRMPRRASPRPLEFTVTFKDARGLQPGQFVVYNGVRIGEVRSVTLDPTGRVRVLVRIAPEHRKRLYREMEFTVDRPGGLVDVSGERQLTAHDRPSVSTRTAIREGDFVQGTEGLLGRVANRMKDLGSWAAEQSSRLAERLGQYADSPEARGAKEELAEVVRRAGEAGRRGVGRLREVDLEELRERIEAFARRLEQAGRSEEAKRLREDFRRFARRLTEED